MIRSRRRRFTPRIREHVTKAGVFNRRDRDSIALNKIVDLIKLHHEDSAGMIQLKTQIVAFEFPENDEQWGVSTNDSRAR